MRRTLCVIGICGVVVFAFVGCNKGGADETPMQPKAGAFDNNAPGAATAGAAPAPTDTPTPGSAGIGKKRMTKGDGAAAPPPSSNN